MSPLRTLLAAAALLLTTSAGAVELNCKGPSNVELFKYSWRLRGGLSWVAGLVFPTSGVGEMKTTYPNDGEHRIDSSLLLTSKVPGFYAYETQIDDTTQRTMMTYHGYAWKDKSRKERTNFDYVKKQAVIHKETPQKQWGSVEPLPPEQIHDIVSAIYYIRQNAASIKGPVTTNIYSDGDLYPVVLKPAERRVFNIAGQNIGALGFAIVDAPGGR